MLWIRSRSPLRCNIASGSIFPTESPICPISSQYKLALIIDSINWVDGGGGGVTIYANTHDVTNSTRYYQWQYTQTWLYNSAEASDYIYNPAAPISSLTGTPRPTGLYLLEDDIFDQYPHRQFSQTGQ